MRSDDDDISPLQPKALSRCDSADKLFFLASLER